MIGGWWMMGDISRMNNGILLDGEIEKSIKIYIQDGEKETGPTLMTISLNQLIIH